MSARFSYLGALKPLFIFVHAVIGVDERPPAPLNNGSSLHTGKPPESQIQAPPRTSLQ